MLERIDKWKWKFVLHGTLRDLPLRLGERNPCEYASHDQEYGYTLCAVEHVALGKVARIDDVAEQLLILLAGQMRRGIFEDSRGTKGRREIESNISFRNFTIQSLQSHTIRILLESVQQILEYALILQRSLEIIEQPGHTLSRQYCALAE